MQKKYAFFTGVLEGMALPGSIYPNTRYPRVTGSDRDRLRGDSLTVGMDFRKVIDRENGKKTKQK
jgi:hypothetical protein